MVAADFSVVFLTLSNNILKKSVGQRWQSVVVQGVHCEMKIVKHNRSENNWLKRVKSVTKDTQTTFFWPCYAWNRIEYTEKKDTQSTTKRAEITWPNTHTHTSIFSDGKLNLKTFSRLTFMFSDDLAKNPVDYRKKETKRCYRGEFKADCVCVSLHCFWSETKVDATQMNILRVTKPENQSSVLLANRSRSTFFRASTSGFWVCMLVNQLSGLFKNVNLQIMFWLCQEGGSWPWIFKNKMWLKKNWNSAFVVQEETKWYFFRPSCCFSKKDNDC